MRLLLSRFFTGAGLIGLALVGAVYLHGSISSRAAIAAFERANSPDQSLWSGKARAKFAEAVQEPGTPVALLKIDRLNLLAPVFTGTDAITLNRGIGIVEGSPMPGEVGNVALSGHRDSFFRPLKDIAVGDVIELQNPSGTQNFQVTDIRIVDPLDTSVLDPADETVLTLITCFPFYYVGFAPDRYIVRAKLVESGVARLADLLRGG